MEATAKQTLRVHIRWMIRRDMPEVLDIERESFEFPWFEEDFIRCLRQRNCIGMVAEHAEHVVGMMIYELHKTKLHILNFAVPPGLRGRGIARQMVEKLVGKLSSQRRTTIALEIRERNVDGQKFFSHMGFRAVNTLHDFYDDSPEDAIVFVYKHVAQDVCLIPKERIEMETQEAKAPQPVTKTATGFPTATKLEPIYKTADGKLHQRLLEKEAKDDPLAVRHTDEETKKRIWLKPLTQ